MRSRYAATSTNEGNLTVAKGQTTKSKSKAAAEVGAEDVVAGAELLDEAAGAARKTVDLAAAGAADTTRGEDELAASAAFDQLSDAAAGQGLLDAAEGAEVLDVAEQVAAVSTLMAAVTADDMERGMFLASLSGQIRVAADVVDLMNMPILSAFLGQKGRQLRGLAVNEIGRAMAAAALSEGMEAMSDRLALLGMNEVAEGLRELDTSEALRDARDDAVSAGLETAAAGVAEMSAASAEARATQQLAGAGVVMVAQGSEEIGAAEGLEAAKPKPKRATRKPSSRRKGQSSKAK